ncbi:penicillin amidase [Polymorphobacter multimanifer]|nr:penicillin amidase [Polymorphobacter multimanifer]
MRGLIGLLAAVATVLVGLMSWDGLTAEASIPDAPVRHEVRIVRDGYGVPHIIGKTDADVGYGVAMAHAQDDFANIEDVVAAVRGRAGAITGEEGAKIDFARGLLQPNEAAKVGYPRLSAASRLVLEGYARGLNEWVRTHPSAPRVRGLFPVNGEDILAGFMLRSPFFIGLDKPLGALVAGTPVPRDSGPADERGSNAFAVSAARSDDGVTRLIVNSHQPWEGGVAWWELVVHSDEGWDFAGALFPGSPFPLVGHNKTLGWANTVNRPDLVDVYKLEVDAAGENYRFDGAWRPLEARRIWLRVKMGPFVLPVPRTVYRSVHGPVIKNDQGFFAIRYAGIGEPGQIDQYYRLNKARDFAEWSDAMATQGVAGTNFVYADAQGHVAMIYNAKFPKRPKGFDWKGVLPGNTSKALWTGYEPYTAYPKVVDPASGWVGNANNTPFMSTAATDELDPKSFPEEMGIETYITNRTWRYYDLFAAVNGPISREALLRIKFDKGYDKRSWAGRWMAAVLAVEDPALAEAQALLRSWDWTQDGEGAADALAANVLGKGVRAGYGGVALPDAAPELRAAVDELMATFGTLTPSLGDYQRVRRGDVDLPVMGGPDALRAIYAPVAEDGRRVGNNGDGFMMVVEWPKDGAVRSESIHQFGAATIRTKSPHYNDQVALFVVEKWKPVLFDRDIVGAN